MNTKILISLLLCTAFFCSCGNKSNNDKKAEGSTIVEMETSEGTIKLVLYDDTPLHRDNFIKLVKEKYYDGVIFHRVIQEFMVQAGDPNSKNPQPGAFYGSGGPDYTIPAEILPNHMHKKGALAAARQGDEVNPDRESSGSQFYIVQGKKFIAQELDVIESHKQKTDPGFKFTSDQRYTYNTVGGAPHLDGGYTVFGEVTEGLKVIDKIAAIPVDGYHRPVKDVFITKIKIK